MRAVLGFAVLLAGLAAVGAHLSEPQRFVTDMSVVPPTTDRLPAYSAVGQGVAQEAAQPVGEFQTTASATRDLAARAEPAAKPADVTPTIASGSDLDLATREALARDIQSELARLGCYSGPVSGTWSAEAQRAADAFVAKANARIPVSQPDFALFSLAKTATPEQACGPAITIAAEKPVVEPPSMSLGGPGERRPRRAAAYYEDRSVQSLFTHPLGR